jgi:hypothetical protein
MHSNRFLSAPALAGLKDFQRKTVEYVFKRLYGDDPTSRFLIAVSVLASTPSKPKAATGHGRMSP